MRLRAAILACLLSSPGAWARERPAVGVEAEPRFEFLSGHVVEFSDSSITVARTIPGKPVEKRAFRVTPETKIEGKLRHRARVTVGYQSRQDGDVAIRIIVRSATPPPPKKQS